MVASAATKSYSKLTLSLTILPSLSSRDSAVLIILSLNESVLTCLIFLRYSCRFLFSTSSLASSPQTRHSVRKSNLLDRFLCGEGLDGPAAFSSRSLLNEAIFFCVYTLYDTQHAQSPMLHYLKTQDVHRLFHY